jgi:hypothetical protein
MLTSNKVFEQFQDNNGFVRPLVENIKYIFPDTEVLSFDELADKSGGVLSGFLNWSGINSFELALDGRPTNERQSDAVVRFIDYVNAKDVTGFASARNDFLSDLHIFRKFKVGKFYLRHAELEKFMPILRNEDSWLSDNFKKYTEDNKIDSFRTDSDQSSFKIFVENNFFDISSVSKSLILEYFESYGK